MTQDSVNTVKIAEEPKIDEVKALAEIKNAHKKILSEIGKVFIGQTKVVEEVLYALFAQGHVLLIGVPGLGKTLLVNSLAQLLDLAFKRVQFTPDLMPSDIIGTEIIEENMKTGDRNFRFVKGPLFTQLLLADEINRTPPKTQAALLQAMQERKITLCWQLRTPLSRKAPTPCQKPSSIASCLTCAWNTHRQKKK